jgi:N-acetylglucosaminyldiphosphoundecaprenol N-acetyl-beta-D-mannosaminyltransferase
LASGLRHGLGKSLPFDPRGLMLLAAMAAGAARVGRLGAPVAAPALVLLGLTAALSLALLATDWLARPRGLRALWSMVLVTVLAGGEPLVSSVKLPFTTRYLELGWAGWPVSWLWVWLFGSLFARAGTLAPGPAGLAAIAGAVFWVACLSQPAVTGELPRLLAVLLVGGGIGTACLAGAAYNQLCTAGAFTIGALVGIVAALGMLKNTAALAVLLPLLVIGMPLFAAVAPGGVWRRRQLPARPQHLHEILLRQGHTSAQVAAIQLAGAAYLGVLAVLLIIIVQWHWTLKLLLVGLWLVGGSVVGYTVVRLLPRPLAPPHSGPMELRLFGLRLHALTMAEALEIARGFLRSGQPHYIVTCDAAALSRAQEDEAFRRVVNEADLVTADGAGVVLAARLLGLPVEVRVAGCDLVEGLCRVAAEEGQGVFFLGAEPGVAEEAAARLAARIPALRIAGCQHGYYPPAEEPQIVERIAQAHPGVLLVALGQPRQEFFIAQYLRRIGARVAIGIGGSLDVLSGRKRRAPTWMQRMGLEWLYRVLQEPARLPRLKALPRVVLMAFRELLRGPSPWPLQGRDASYPPRRCSS